MRLSHEQLLNLWWEQTREHALIALDAEGVIIAWGGDAQSLFDYSATEIVGQKLEVLFTSEDVETQAPQKELLIANAGAPAEDDRWMRRRDGSRFWATGVLQALRGPDGVVVGYTKLLRNRTDLKGQLESHKNEMQKLRAGDDRKNGFITTLAHELRNPLAALAMAADILELSPDDAESREFAIGAIKRQVEFSSRLIEDLLDLTRLQKGKLRLKCSEVDLRSILGTAAEAVRPLIAQKQQSLHLIFGNQPVGVMADADRLQQVFVNLIQNASKYTPDAGNVWVKLFLEGGEAAVKVEDDGMGISSDVLPKIFDLFTQALTSEQASVGGLGIGLSVVKDLVQLHGGSVQVRSDGLGHGSEFSVRLPLIAAKERGLDDPDGGGP